MKPTRVARTRLLGGVLAGLAALALAGAALSLGAWQEEGFPHDRHVGLFPLCTGCHEGIPEGEEASYYPEADVCAGCHDGVDQVRVTWSAPAPRETNLTFVHDAHAGALEREDEYPLTCVECHSEEDERMFVTEEVEAERCWMCHEATEHQLDAECSTCHLPLAGSGLGRAAIEALPEPEDHEVDDFVLEGHGEMAEASTGRCATCHTADRCLTCHVDGDTDEIRSLDRAPEAMELPPAEAHYPEPGNHGDDGWLSEHGGQASRAECATCHTSDDCSSCHAAPVPDVIATLPSRAQSLAPGVAVMPHAPDNHDSYFFQEVHGTLAAGDGGTCATCHREAFCVECHDGPSDGGYHPPSFVSRHAAEAFGRDTECANCHNAQAFCRSCHVEMGLTGFGRLGPGYHEAQSLWLLRHGQAARQNLESCASCHKQNDCTQCHGVLGAFQVNPHSRDFDAERAWARSPRTCIGCHTSNPLDGGGVP